MCYQLHNLSIFSAFMSSNFLALLHLAYLLKSNNQKHNSFMRIKKCKFGKGLIAWKYFKLIEVQCNLLFLSAFGIEVDVNSERKRVSRMGENSYFSITGWTFWLLCCTVISNSNKLILNRRFSRVVIPGSSGVQTLKAKVDADNS